MACKYFIDGKQLSEQEVKSYISDKYIDSKDIKFTTLDDIANILAYSNSKIILDGWKIEYSTPLGNKYDTLEEVNQEIRNLANNILEPIQLTQEQEIAIDSVWNEYPVLKEIFKGNKSLYQHYLNSIFPGSEEKDIYLHQTNIDFKDIGFDKNKIGSNTNNNGYYGYGFYFVKDTGTPIDGGWGGFASAPIAYGEIEMPVILNIKKIKNGITTIQKDPKKLTAKLKKEGYDSINAPDGLVVFEPEQIHILGSKQDIQQAKQFVKNNVEVDLSGVKIPESKDIKNVEDIPVDNFMGVDGRLYEKQKDGWKLIRDKVEKGEIKRYYESQSDENIIYQYNIKDGWFDGSDFTRSGIEGFIEKNNEYEQSKEIIEQWKKENNIQYDPEEVYSRGQGFYSSIGAYSNLELDLLLKNLIQHIEDNKKAGEEKKLRLYRIENKNIPYDETREGIVSKKEIIGGFFTDSIDTVSNYIRKNQSQEGINLVYVDISKDDLDKYHVSKNEYAKTMDVESDNWIIPSSINRSYVDLSSLPKVTGNIMTLSKAKQELKSIIDNLPEIQSNINYGFTISAFTKPVDKRLKHIEGIGDRVRFVIYPKSEHIKWAAPTDVYSGSVWDAHEKVSKDKKSELLGVSFTKAPALSNINEVSPNLADIVDNFSHVHNELGIELTTNNFRIEYDDNIDYSTKKLIDNINKILDDKYGKLEKPEIKKEVIESENVYILRWKNGNVIGRYDSLEAAKKAQVGEYTDSDGNKISAEEVTEIIKGQPIEKIGKQPTQTRENTTSIESVKDEVLSTANRPKSLGELQEGDGFIYFEKDGKYFKKDLSKQVDIEITKEEYEGSKKEYTQQALINLKVAALKEIARKYPRSLITSKVVPINPNMIDNSEIQYSKTNNNTEQQTPEDLLTKMIDSGAIQKDCTGGFKAKNGIRGKFTKGSQWEIYEIFEGKSHKQGGIDINIKNNQISFTNKNGSIKAKYGLVISKDS